MYLDPSKLNMSTDSSSVKHFIYRFPRSGNPCCYYYVLLLLLAVPAGCLTRRPASEHDQPAHLYHRSNF